MLQKYHPNPLSHFLALHNSQATHNHVVDAHTLATTLASTQFHHHHHHQHQQHQQLQQQQHHHQQQQQQHHHHHQQQQQQQQSPHLQQIQLEQHHQQNVAVAFLAANQHHQTGSHHIQLTAHNLNSHTSPAQPPSPNQIPASEVNQHTTTNQRHHHHHQNSSHAQQLIEAAANTTLDAGKSFTIAAILGLQKSAMENSCKEYANNVINLSLNGGNSSSNDDNSKGNANGNIHHQPHLSTPEHRHKEELQYQQQHSAHSQPHHPSNNNNNNRDVTNLNLSKTSNICHSYSNNTSSSALPIAKCNTVNSSFNCDNVVGNATAAAAATALMNRYLPSAMVNVNGSVGVVGPPMTPAMAHHQHQQSRANSFVAAAAAAAAAAANGVPGGPSALQSLQQLHQQHAAHQTTLSFQREKLKSESSAKKSSLKNKRVRTIFTPEQLERLEAEFERQQYMVGPERLYLAHTLQLTEAQVKVWFQNRRIKWRKHHLEMTQQRLALLRQTQIPPVNSNDDQTPVKVDVNDDDDDCQNIKREDLRDLSDSRQDTESELSICNDSMDAESIIDDEDET